MNIRLAPYSEYKDSGLAWLGRIPKHWKVRRSKYLLREVNARSSDGQEQLLSVSQYTGVTPRRSRDGGGEPDTRAASLVGYKRVAENDLVVNIMLAWNGSLGVARSAGIVSPAYCVYQFNDHAEPWYYHNLLRLPIYKGRIKVESTGVVESRLRLYSDDLFRIEAPVPPKEEQVAIARFVETFSREVDRLIRAKRRLIELLNERKQAIIHRAVTRGLDPNVRLKPSGNEWLGEVPEHWEVVPLRWHLLIGSGEFLSADQLGSERTAEMPYPVIGGNGVMAYAGRFNTQGITIVIGRVGALCGNIHLVTERSWITDNALRITNIKGFDPDYLALQLEAMNLNRLANANAQPLITGGMIKSQRVIRPTTQEQRRIVQQLREAIAPLEFAIDRAHREIDLLREYRTRLNADVVTGKLDVRGVELPKLDEAEALEDREFGEEVEVDETGDTEEAPDGDEQ